MKSGLRALKEDVRDYQLGAVAVLPTLEELPNKFRMPTFGIRDQKDSDFCTAFTLCEISGQQEGVELSPEWSFAMTKHLEGSDSYGADLRDACKVHVKYGGLERKDSPYSLDTYDQGFLRNPEVWDASLIDKAAPHKKKTYFKVTGPYDAFDNIRASMYKYNSGVAIGVVWGWPMTKVFIDSPVENGSGHAMAVVGWDNDYLIVKQTYGESAGDKGFQYIHKSVINANVDKYGAFMLLDLDPPVVTEKRSVLCDTALSLVRLWVRKTMRVGALGIYPVPTWLKNYLTKLPKIQQLGILARYMKGADLSYLVDSDVGCAEAVSRIIRIVLPDFQVVTGTYTLYSLLEKDNRFVRITTPQNGCIVLSPTGFGNGTIRNGHTGIYVDGRIYSNDSAQGKWLPNYNVTTWSARWKVKGAYPVFYYKLIA